MPTYKYAKGRHISQRYKYAQLLVLAENINGLDTAHLMVILSAREIEIEVTENSRQYTEANGSSYAMNTRDGPDHNMRKALLSTLHAKYDIMSKQIKFGALRL